MQSYKRERGIQKKKKLPLRARSMCENELMARRRSGKREEEVSCYAPVKAVGFRLWLLHVAEAH